MRRRPRKRGPLAADAPRPLLLYSRTCQHALRAMERLAAADLARPGSLRSLATVAAETGTPHAALAQIVHRLRRAGLLAARRGPSGGVRLARPAAQIPVLEIVRVIEGVPLEARCILGFPACGDATPCPAHPVWKKARALLEARLESRSLADLVRAVARKSAALTARRRPTPAPAARAGRRLAARTASP
ncbi:MAG: RrF2 family transcriptional regulator [Acidobacteriota bacterium]